MAAGAEINSYKPTSEDSSARRLHLGVGPLQFRGSVEMRAAPRSLQALGWTSQMADRFSAETEQGLLPESFYSEAVAAIIVTFIQGLWRIASISYYRSSWRARWIPFQRRLAFSRR